MLAIPNCGSASSINFVVVVRFIQLVCSCIDHRRLPFLTRKQKSATQMSDASRFSFGIGSLFRKQLVGDAP